MMYTWGYIKNVALAKLDLTEDEAEVQNLIGRFPYYLNEVITQVSSTVKPDKKYYSIQIFETDTGYWNYLVTKYPELEYKLNEIIAKPDLPAPFSPELKSVYDSFWKEWSVKQVINNVLGMPKDFISFGDDVNKRTYFDEIGCLNVEEVHDDDIEFLGRREFVCYKAGTYRISYNARWYIPSSIDTNYQFDIPDDIMDCVPSYIASQCFKIDDEYKATVFRNEYEMFLARIDDTDFKNTKTFAIGGDW